MNININKDFEKHYKDDAWRGFTLKEVCCMLLFLILLFGMVFFLLEMVTYAAGSCRLSGSSFWSSGALCWFFEVSRDDTSRACKRNGI